MDASNFLQTNSPNFLAMAEKWPSAIVARCEVGKFSGGIVNPRTLANWDSLGTGPPGRFRIGRKIAYPVLPFIEWLAKRAEVV